MAFCFIYKNSDYNLLPIEGGGARPPKIGKKYDFLA
jgi:hypothetical protein